MFKSVTVSHKAANTPRIRAKYKMLSFNVNKLCPLTPTDGVIFSNANVQCCLVVLLLRRDGPAAAAAALHLQGGDTAEEKRDAAFF